MQDFTGVPAVVDLAAMRDAMSALGGDAEKINPLVPVDLVIDHSVMVDDFGTPSAFGDERRARVRAQRRALRVPALGPEGLRQFPRRAAGHRHLPPGQSRISRAGGLDQEGRQETIAYPDTLVGTDSHTTMVNGLGVLGWGVGGIEAEAAMLGQPMSMLIPEVVGFKLTGTLREGVTATDLVLTVTQMLRKKGVVGKFVEFYGPGLDALSLADRATIANMAPEYGATCGFFPIDDETLALPELDRPRRTARQLVEAYAKEQGLWRARKTPDPVFTDTLSTRSGRRRALPRRAEAPAGPRAASAQAAAAVHAPTWRRSSTASDDGKRVTVEGVDYDIGHGDVVIAAITRCTNTSNPSVMIAAGLVARKAVKRGLKVKPWVKTSLAPGTQVVTDYLEGPACRRISTRSASTWSAMAAPPASAIRARCPIRSTKAVNEAISWSAPCCRATATSRAASIR